MATTLTLSGKRLQATSASAAVYRTKISIVDDTPQNSYELQGPIAAATPITLPDGGTYTGNELQVRLNGVDMVPVLDYNFEGTGTRTQISFTFKLIGTRANPDVIEFYKE